MHTEDGLWDLLDQATSMPYGAAQIALAEQIIAAADAMHATDLGFRARMLATTSYVYGGEPVKSFVTFAWCVAEYDRDPARFADQTRFVLWHHKYMVSGMTRFPEIPLRRTYDALDEMQRRWRETGHSPHAVYAHRHRVALHVGDVEAAQEWYDRWCAAPRDDLSDCVGCDPSSKAWYLASLGRDEEAVELADQVIDGSLTCSEQPQDILTTLLLPYLRTGRLDLARDAHRRAYRLLRPNLSDLGSISSHLEFCALTGNEARGLEILEHHLGWLDRPPSPHAAMSFAAAGALVLRRAREVGQPPGRFRRPAHEGRHDTTVEADALAIELASLALDTAARFDERNGTSRQTELVRQRLDAVPIVDRLPLTPTPASRPTTLSVSTWDNPAGSSAVGAGLGGLHPDELLDLAEDHLRHGRRGAAFAAWHAFDEQYAAAELTPSQRGRRADGHGVEAANGDALAEAETAWRSAADSVRRSQGRGAPAGHARPDRSGDVRHRPWPGRPAHGRGGRVLPAGPHGHRPVDRRAGGRGHRTALRRPARGRAAVRSTGRRSTCRPASTRSPGPTSRCSGPSVWVRWAGWMTPVPPPRRRSGSARNADSLRAWRMPA